ncbi:MAG TPA: hydrogenase/urease maturation nickel metallochaperone HypA [Streptosporangiaceae bacterium]|nr:hydrogenase/urease maturation nickel metallochaperone HypA [Streptosporangiaceae bacterium]
MHESGLVRATVAALVDASAGRPMRTVVLAVGAGVDVDSAAAAWQAAAAGTSLAATRVEWQRAPDRLRCFACGLEYDGEPLDLCPSCEGTGIVITPAPELAAVDWTP